MAKRYFEFVEGTSSKFWEIWIEGTEVRTRYGRIGAAGQTTVKDQGSAAAAKKLHDSLVAEKTKKGYVESKAGAAATGTPKAPTSSAKAPAKPSRIDDAVRRIEAKAKAAKVTLGKGASDKAIAAAEKTLGFALPEAVREFYRRHDGASAPAVAGRELLSCKRMLAEWTIWKQLLDKGTFEDNDHGEPGPGVQKKWWIPEWVPVTYDGAGNHHVIDCAPGKGGTIGQIVDFWHDEPSRRVVGKDLVTWLAGAEWGDPDADDDDDDDDDGDDEDED
jgi:cell wall assembly regulator SMI1/predicted DNA-binding WGR domain protein